MSMQMTFCNAPCDDFECPKNAGGVCHAPNRCLSYEEAEKLMAELEAAKRELAEYSSAVGNIAAWREALKEIERKCNSLDEECAVDPVEIRDIARAALAEPARVCDAFGGIYDTDNLHAAFVKHCNECDCPMGCIHRRDTRFMLDTQCASILKCFAKFVLERKERSDGGE